MIKNSFLNCYFLKKIIKKQIFWSYDCKVEKLDFILLMKKKILLYNEEKQRKE